MVKVWSRSELELLADGRVKTLHNAAIAIALDGEIDPQAEEILGEVIVSDMTAAFWYGVPEEEREL